MTKHKNKQEKIEEELEQEIIEELEQIKEKQDIDSLDDENKEILKLKDLLARTQADFSNFENRTARDKVDMIFFLKQDIFKKILPRLDDLERILKNTPDENKIWVLFEWVSVMEAKFKVDLEKMWVKAFISIWEEVNPLKHEVMTTIPGKQEGIIVDEFEKWYYLDDKVLRYAKVVAWAWE